MKDPANPATGMLIAANVLGATLFTLKCLGLIFVQMWLRWTLPRPRIDLVLYACMKVLLPMACAILLGASLWQLLVPERYGVPWWDYNPYSLSGWEGATAALVTQIVLTVIGVAGFGAIAMWIFYAFVSGRNLKQRLTDPRRLKKPSKWLETYSYVDPGSNFSGRDNSRAVLRFRGDVG